MEDLTQGSIPKHLIKLAVPMAIGMLVHTLYLMIDLYFVGQLGEHALAGVSAAANISMFVLALTQMLNIGTATLISHAVGRKDQHDHHAKHPAFGHGDTNDAQQNGRNINEGLRGRDDPDPEPQPELPDPQVQEIRHDHGPEKPIDQPALILEQQRSGLYSMDHERTDDQRCAQTSRNAKRQQRDQVGSHHR